MILQNVVKIFLFIFLALALAGCGEEHEDTTNIPWNKPANWEGQMPMAGASY